MANRSLTIAGISGLILLGAAGMPANAALQMNQMGKAKPAPGPGPDILVNVITDCFIPLQQMTEAGTITRDQSVASTGIPGCQRPGADDVSVGQMLDEFFVPRQVGVSP